MAQNFPFEINADKYSRQLWSKQAYLYLAEFFRKAVFDTNVQVIEGGTIDDYRLSGPTDDWRLPGRGSGSGASEYRSYFRVIDASTTDPDVCKIGVTNGSSEMLDPVGNCGAVKINGERVDVEAVTETITADGVYHVWIHSWIDAADGPNAEIIVGPVDDNTPPDNPNGGIAFASQLAGRVTVLDGAIDSITQDYLTGGEHTELLFGDCEGGEIQVTP